MACIALWMVCDDQSHTRKDLVARQPTGGLGGGAPQPPEPTVVNILKVFEGESPHRLVLLHIPGGDGPSLGT